MKLPYIIAEIGVNYYDTAVEMNISPLEAAKIYIKKAKEAGINAVKFQTYKAETLASKNSPAYWDLSEEPTTTQYELFRKFDSFGKREYEELSDYCKEIGIDFMSTPFDNESADYLESMMKVYKISSSDITNIPFLKRIARKNKPVILSTGASDLSEIDSAVKTIMDNGNGDLTLLHCVLSYPCKNEDANLNRIKALKRIYPNLKIGYSDHTLPDDSMIIMTTAFLYGAEVIEKHFTLNKGLKGNDHYHAGDPDDFKKAISNFKLISEISGCEDLGVLECEKNSRREARRSLVIRRDMKKGDTIQENDLIAKRPGIGISPKNLEVVVGRKLTRDVERDEILKWDMV